MDVSEKDLNTYRFSEDPYEVTLGEGDTALTEIFDKVLYSMLVGESCYVKSKVDKKGEKVSELALTNKPIKFNMTLKTLSRAADLEDLENDEKLDRAQHHKAAGTDLYLADRILFAEKRYLRSLDCLKAICDKNVKDFIQTEMDELVCQCNLNLAACYLKDKKWSEVIDYCDNVLNKRENNIKALYRKSRAYIGLLEYNKALCTIKSALTIDPKNRDIIRTQLEIQKLIKNDKDVYKKMFK